MTIRGVQSTIMKSHQAALSTTTRTVSRIPQDKRLKLVAYQPTNDARIVAAMDAHTVTIQASIRYTFSTPGANRQSRKAQAAELPEAS